jgi:hypothetical protein
VHRTTTEANPVKQKQNKNKSTTTFRYAAQVDERFTEQTISGINTLTPSVSVHLCGDKLEGVDARSNRLLQA